MAETKYDKYILRDLVAAGKHGSAPEIRLIGERDAGGTNVSMTWNCIAVFILWYGFKVILTIKWNMIHQFRNTHMALYL